MKYTYERINKEHLNEIESWKYPGGFMETIYMAPYHTNFKEKGVYLGPLDCDGYMVLDNGKPFGFFEYYHKENGLIEIGLALHPDNVGKGLSKEFILDGIQFGIKEFNYEKDLILITVEMGNDAAFYSYLKTGFVETKRTDEEIFMEYKL